MGELKVLLSKLSRSDQIKSYQNKIQDSLVLIKRCVAVDMTLQANGSPSFGMSKKVLCVVNSLTRSR